MTETVEDEKEQQLMSALYKACMAGMTNIYFHRYPHAPMLRMPAEDRPSSKKGRHPMNPEHLLIAALVALLLIYGPNKLPQLGSALGKTVKNVRDGMESDDERTVEPEIEDPDDADRADSSTKAA
jgi:sec-independent protein translocase protein TatA